MLPPAIKTIRDEIFYQYSKIISESAGFGKENYGFIMSKWKKLKNGEETWSTAIREWVKEHENPDECIYCGSRENLTTEHILPRDRGGPDISDNAIRICKSCNSGKGDKRLYEWKGLKSKDKHSRIAEGKYLKLLYRLHEENNTLNVHKERLKSKLCPKCDMGKLCKEANKAGKLTVYCLEGVFVKK